ncbi:transposase [Streptomyces sp. NPDC058964]|uniref:transposase n=1 Tax=Streptomyces sp. NPDC058964 TaxID=3346681 RepID=UPI0036A4FA7D
MTSTVQGDRLSGAAGLAPVARDSGRISGNMCRPRHHSRRLMRVFYMSAMVSAPSCPVSQAFYELKRVEGKSHRLAIIALARRRLNVLSPLIDDGRAFEATPPPSGRTRLRTLTHCHRHQSTASLGTSCC